MNIINHILGTCGESHINIFTVLAIVVTIKLIINESTRNKGFLPTNRDY